MQLKKIFFNRYFDKNRLKALILWSLTNSGEKKTIDLVEKLKDLGFHYATQAGLSLGIDDLKIPPTKSQLILEAELTVQASQLDYEIGNVTIIEKFQQLIDVWHRTSEILKQNVVQHFRSTDILNPVYMMAFSGARGNISQVRQLVGMRGLMADPQGQILEFPIRSNFREGLTLTEYVISCYGARKGLVDTALRTANSGYLTRRLVDVAQHIIVRQLDCGTTNGILISDMKDGKKVLFSLQKRLIGRVLAEPIEKIAKKNKDISPALALEISKRKNQVLVRSPLSCEAKNSICQLCYGWSLAHGNLVSLGEAVGILAAQSIGEPGTQLTMRTFHTGGVFSGDVMQEIRSPFEGKIQFKNPLQGLLIRTLHGKIAFLTKIEGELTIYNDLSNLKRTYNIPSSTVLFAREDEKVSERQLLAEYSSVVTTSNQGIQAKYNLNSIIEGQIFYENVLLLVKNPKEGDIVKTALKFGSLWVLSGKLYKSIIGSNLYIKPNDLVDTRSIVNESIFVTPYNGYLTTDSKEKNKYQFLTKKINILSNQKEFLKQFITGQKALNYKNSISKTNKIKIQTDLIYNQNFFEINSKKIYYKKFGYFIFLSKNSENCSTQTSQQLFLPNSLKENSLLVNQLSLQWSIQKTFQNQALILKDKNYFFDQKGQLFIKLQSHYQIPFENILNFYNSKFLTIRKQPKKNFTIKNKQGIKLKIFLNKNNNIKTFKRSQTEIAKKSKSFIKKQNFTFRKNPLSEIKNQADSKQNLQKSFENIFKKLQLSFNAEYFYLTKNKIRKNEYIYHKFHKLSGNLLKNNFLKIESTKLNLIKKEKAKTFKVQIIDGWNFLPINLSQVFILTNSFLTPTYQVKNNHFDQTFIYFETNISNTEEFYFLKIKVFHKLRFVKNKLFRYNKFHNFKIEEEKPNFVENPSQNFLKETFSNNNKFKIKKYAYLDLLNNSNFSFSINRNKLYKKNFKIKLQFLLKIEKLIESRNSNSLEQKKIFQKIIKEKNKFFSFDLKSFNCNKQTVTKLKLPTSNIDLKIQPPKFNVIEKERNKNFYFQPVQISFSNQTGKLLQKTQLKVKFGKIINFAISQKIESVNYLFDQLKTKNKVLMYGNNYIIQQNNLLFNSFFSPYSGEITTLTTDLIGKDKSLVLTSKNQITFSTNQEIPIRKIGELVRYGDQLLKGVAISESGQITQIDQNKITLRKAQPILFSSQGIFHVDNGDIVEKDTPVITLFYQKLKTEDIVQGIPKIEELFEARQTKEGETLQENLHSKLTLLFNFYKQQYTSQEAARRSIEKIQQILVNNVQKVYQSQGVSIADKHIEIIVRQMTTKVKITESGRTGLLRGELIDLEWVEVINLGIEAQNELTNQGIEVEKAEYEPIILGITKAALETESFISASSFQETTRILSRAAIERKTDFLRGLKENVILGHLIPAGTGFTLSFDSQIKVSNNLKKISSFSYKEIIKNFSNIKKTKK